MESMHDLEILIDSGRQLIVLETEREGCFIEGFRRLAARSEKAYFQWTLTQGLLRLAPDYQPQVVNKDLNQLFAQIQSTQQPSVYVLVDLHHHINEPVTIRHIKDVLIHSPQHSLVLLSQAIDLPEELKHKASHYRLPLPETADLYRMVNDLAVAYLGDKQVKLQVAEKDIVKRLVASLCGLSYSDAHRMARHAIYNDGIIDDNDLTEIARNKFELLNTNNVLNLELDFAELSDLAGFENLKKWLDIRRPVFSGKVSLPGNDKPKGLLLLGVQGCGKSLAAKAVAGSWQLPLLHLDFGTLYNRFYGQTEENLRSALNAAEKMQPCVLWIDEIEKGMSAVSQSDDVSKRLLGTFLTWLAEKSSSVFVVATANDVAALPPELMRKGRFDEVFFVDLPTKQQREQILDLHLRKRQCTPESIDIQRIAALTDGFSGAELEQLIVSAMYHTYARESSVTSELLVRLVGETKPLSILMKEKIQQLQRWAETRAVRV